MSTINCPDCSQTVRLYRAIGGGALCIAPHAPAPEVAACPASRTQAPTCRECSTPHGSDITQDCSACGESLGVSCRTCSNPFAHESLDAHGNCEDCCDSAVRVARRERMRDDHDARGDYMRDRQRGECAS
jgi:hypothetical protein